jgi:hypothetical protein
LPTGSPPRYACSAESCGFDSWFRNILLQKKGK